MKGISLTLSVVLALLFSIQFVSCDLFEDDEHCQYTKDKTSNWSMGTQFIFGVYEAPFNDDVEVDIISLGFKGEMIVLEDVCTSRPVVVTAQLRTKYYKPGFKPYLIVASSYGGKKLAGRGVPLLGATADATTFSIDPIEIPVWPDFSTDGFLGSLKISIMLRPDLGVFHKDEANWRVENYLNDLILDANISTSYTYY
jgi:hypothetical protein